MKRRIITIAGMAAVCSMLYGCAASPARTPEILTVRVQAEFDAEQARRLMADGVNIIKGNAFMRQRGGGVVTCAGAQVFLIPATEYAARRINIIYGTGADRAFTNAKLDMRFNPDPPEYYSLTKSTRCDAQGNFSFDRVADGEFFVQTSVSWEVARRIQGGQLMQRVKVSNGSVANVILSS